MEEGFQSMSTQLIIVIMSALTPRKYVIPRSAILALTKLAANAD